MAFTFRELTNQSAKRFSDRTAVVCGDARLSFNQVKERGSRLANTLMGLGAKKGDRIAIIQENCEQYMEISLAIPKTGMILVPLNYRLSGKELSYLINNAEPHTLIVGPKYEEVIKSITTEIHCVIKKMLTFFNKSYKKFHKKLNFMAIGILDKIN